MVEHGLPRALKGSYMKSCPAFLCAAEGSADSGLAYRVSQVQANPKP